MAVATTPAEAREKIIDKAPEYFTEHFFNGFYDKDNEIHVEYFNRYMNDLQIDLSGPYETLDVVMLRGSE